MALSRTKTLNVVVSRLEEQKLQDIKRKSNQRRSLSQTNATQLLENELIAVTVGQKKFGDRMILLNEIVSQESPQVHDVITLQKTFVTASSPILQTLS